MINPLVQEIESPGRHAYRPRVLQGGMATLDIEHITQTMALLENYVDSLLAAVGPPGTDPWIDDEDIATRMACL